MLEHNYYSFEDMDEAGNPVIKTFSDQEILDTFYHYWYNKMVEKFGKEYVDNTYSKKECIEDWCIVNYAYKV